MARSPEECMEEVFHILHNGGASQGLMTCAEKNAKQIVTWMQNGCEAINAAKNVIDIHSRVSGKPKENIDMMLQKVTAGAPKPLQTAAASVSPAGVKSVTPAAASGEKVVISLPTEKSVPKEKFGEYSFLLYGERKIGKTTLAAEFPDAFFMMFEPGGKGLSIFQRDMASWAVFKEYVKLLKTTKQYQTIVLDTVDIAYERCQEYVGNKNGFKHPSEMNDFGKSWDAISDEFKAVILEIAATGRGVVFISHAIESEFQEASGNKYNKIVQSMSNRARKFIGGWVDVIGYYGYYGKERYLTIEGADSVDAGHRIQGHFLAKNEEGVMEKIRSIPMGNSPQEGYQNLLDAFDNKQEVIVEPNEVTGLSEKKVKPTVKGK